MNRAQTFRSAPECHVPLFLILKIFRMIGRTSLGGLMSRIRIEHLATLFFVILFPFYAGIPQNVTTNSVPGMFFFQLIVKDPIALLP